jgi:hypothetical protein
MRKALTIFGIVLLLSFHPGALQAAIIVHLDGEGDVTGIDNLPISGIGTFDVTFHAESYDTLFPGEVDPFFLGNESGAQTAATSIVNHLNSLETVPGINLGQSFINNFAIPYYAPSSQYLSWGGTYDSEEDEPYSVHEFGATNNSGIYNAIGTFESSSVPEPSILVGLASLAGMGLIGRWWRRRKKA